MDSSKRDGSHEKNTKNNWNIKPYLAMGAVAFLVIVFSISVFFVIFRYRELSALLKGVSNILQPIVMGLVLAYLLNPIVGIEEKYLQKLLEKKKGFVITLKIRKVMRAIGIFGALILAFVFVSILLKLVIPELYKSISGVIIALPDQVQNSITWIRGMLDSDSQLAGAVDVILTRGATYLEQWIQTDLMPQINTLIGSLTTGVIGLVRVLLNVVIGIIISVYVLMSKETFSAQSKKLVYAILPSRVGNIFINTVRKSNEIFGGFISGKILDSLIIGILCMIVLYFLNMPYMVLVSVIVGVTNVIPFFGPYIGAIPCTILILLASPIQGLYFVIFIFILQQIDGNIIGPKILGDSTGLSAFWVVFSILLGGGLFGFIGMIMGVPVFAIIYYITKQIIQYLLERKKLPYSTEAYKDVLGVDEFSNTLKYEIKEKSIKEKSIEEQKE